jgi:hypothetical protein
MRNAYRILVGEAEGKRPLEILRRRWRIILKEFLRKNEFSVLNGLIWLGICLL